MADLPAKALESEKEVLGGLWHLLLRIADEIESLPDELPDMEDAA